MGKKYKKSAEILQLLEESSSDKDKIKKVENDDKNPERAYSSDNSILCTYKNGGRNNEAEVEGGQKFDYNRIKKSVKVKNVVLSRKDYIQNMTKSNQAGQVTRLSFEHPSEVFCMAEGNKSSESLQHNQVVEPENMEIAEGQDDAYLVEIYQKLGEDVEMNDTVEDRSFGSALHLVSNSHIDNFDSGDEIIKSEVTKSLLAIHDINEDTGLKKYCSGTRIDTETMDIADKQDDAYSIEKNQKLREDVEMNEVLEDRSFRSALQLVSNSPTDSFDSADEAIESEVTDSLLTNYGIYEDTGLKNHSCDTRVDTFHRHEGQDLMNMSESCRSPSTRIKNHKKRISAVGTSSKVTKICGHPKVSKWDLRPRMSKSLLSFFNTSSKNKRKIRSRMASSISKLQHSTGQSATEYADPSEDQSRMMETPLATVSMGAVKRIHSNSPFKRKLSFEVSSESSPKSLNKALSSVSRFKCTVSPLKSVETCGSSTNHQLKEENRVLKKENADLRRENTDLRKENDALREEIIRLGADLNSDHRFEVNQPISKEKFVQLNCEKCEKVYNSTAGLTAHCKIKHEPIKVLKKSCHVCGKNVVQLDKHMKRKHSSMVKNVCEICGKSFSKGFKKHRADCIKCTRPLCKYTNAKKQTLIAHIRDCKMEMEITEPLDLRSPFKKQTEPLDLRSPFKKQTEPLDLRSPSIKQTEPLVLKSPYKKQTDTSEIRSPLQTPPESAQTDAVESDVLDSIDLLDASALSLNDGEGSGNICQKPKKRRNLPGLNRPNHSDDKCLFTGRPRFPYDNDNDDEGYLSEIEEGDTQEQIVNRRLRKDKIELSLREIDELECGEYKGDVEFINLYLSFLDNASEDSDGVESESSLETDKPSTHKLYARSLEVNLFPVMHKLYSPFDARDMLDCTSEKQCLFEGKERAHVSPHEPLYLTSYILKKCLKQFHKSEGQQKAIFICAIIRCMHFIESHFNDRLNLYGRVPLENVVGYHNTVKSYLDGNKTWKRVNKQKEKIRSDNKDRKQRLDPSHEYMVLMKCKQFITSSGRNGDIREILEYVADEAKVPDEDYMNLITKIVITEIALATGKRGVVFKRLTNGRYFGGDHGFNPLKDVTDEDSVTDDEDDDSELRRRVNPNLPPKSRACSHQKELNSAECPVKCRDECQPDGWNIKVGIIPCVTFFCCNLNEETIDKLMKLKNFRLPGIKTVQQRACHTFICRLH